MWWDKFEKPAQGRLVEISEKFNIEIDILTQQYVLLILKKGNMFAKPIFKPEIYILL